MMSNSNSISRPSSPSSSSPPLTSYRSRYMRSTDAFAESRRRRSNTSSSSSTNMKPTTKIRPERRLRPVSSSNSLASLTSSTSGQDRRATFNTTESISSCPAVIFADNNNPSNRTLLPMTTTRRAISDGSYRASRSSELQLLSSSNSSSTSSAGSIATDASADTELATNTRKGKKNNGSSNTYFNSSTTRKSRLDDAPSSLKSLQKLKTPKPFDNEIRRNDNLESKKEVLKSQLDSTGTTSSTRKEHDEPSTSSISGNRPTCIAATSNKKDHRRLNEKDSGIRLSEFTSITTALSDDDDEEDDDTDITCNSTNAVDMAAANSKSSNNEVEDAFGTILNINKIVHHVRISSSSRRNLTKNSAATDDDLADNTIVDHRSNYSCTLREGFPKESVIGRLML